MFSSSQLTDGVGSYLEGSGSVCVCMCANVCANTNCKCLSSCVLCVSNHNLSTDWVRFVLLKYLLAVSNLQHMLASQQCTFSIKFFDHKSFITDVDNSSSYELTRLFFCIFGLFCCGVL